MKRITVSIGEIRTLLKRRLPSKQMRMISNMKKSSIPRLIYTSFNGDDLSYSEPMKQYVLKKGFVPLNPESALGTYLVSNHHEGSKLQIIQDCISLLRQCDEFWIVTKGLDKESSRLHNLPEGVIAESIYWLYNKKTPIAIVDIILNKRTHTLRPDHISKIKLKKEQEKGIQDILSLKKYHLRKTIYLLAGDKHTKHSDWMRKAAFNNNLVPLCPHTILNDGSLYMAFGSNFQKGILARISLGINADCHWLFGPQGADAFSVNDLETDVLIDLYLFAKFNKNIRWYYGSFAEIGVPKYRNRRKWAITDFEKNK